MPGRNIVKHYVPNSFYHVFNQGSDGRKIFKNEQDYNHFLNLLSKYLTVSQEGASAVSYPGIELQVYCLLPNSFHLLLYVGENPRDITEFMRRVSTSYSMHFNKKYKRRGQLFETRFRASRIPDEEKVVKISRYVHRQPQGYKAWPYSSLNYFIGDWHSSWVRPDRLYKLYEWGGYEKLLDDHEKYKRSLHEIAPFIANPPLIKSKRK